MTNQLTYNGGGIYFDDVASELTWFYLHTLLSFINGRPRYLFDALSDLQMCYSSFSVTLSVMFNQP